MGSKSLKNFDLVHDTFRDLFRDSQRKQQKKKAFLFASHSLYDQKMVSYLDIIVGSLWILESMQINETASN